MLQNSCCFRNLRSFPRGHDFFGFEHFLDISGIGELLGHFGPNMVWSYQNRMEQEVIILEDHWVFLPIWDQEMSELW